MAGYELPPTSSGHPRDMRVVGLGGMAAASDRLSGGPLVVGGPGANMVGQHGGGQLGSHMGQHMGNSKTRPVSPPIIQVLYGEDIVWENMDF